MVHVRLFGPFELTVQSASRTSPLEARRAQELLAFLLLTPGLASSRTAAAEAVWPEVSAATSRKQIRQALWHIHHAVDEADGRVPRLVLADCDHLVINPNRAVWCDALDFARTLGGPARCSAEGAEFFRALELYRGPLLDGCYADWCLIERERFEGLYLTALDDAAASAQRRGDVDSAIRWASALLGIDPAHELSHSRLMRIYYARGDRTRALRQFKRCRRALETELGVQPSARTAELAAVIRDGAACDGEAGAGRIVMDSEQLARELAALRQAVEDLRRSVVEHLV